jgi:predicted transcriptional regulator
MAKMTRLSEEVSQKIEALADQLKLSKQKIIENAVKSYEKEVFFKKLDVDYGNLKKDAQAWKEFQEEIGLWDIVDKDGLENE